MEALDGIRALTFDVFGTVVDWRSSIVREGDRIWRRRGADIDWAAFADAWRARYIEAMVEGAKEGALPRRLDDLHRRLLEEILPEFGLDGLSEAGRAELNQVWHRLDPWPDSLPGMNRLRRKYILAAHSNGNIALIVNMAKRSDIPWDVVLGAEVTGVYKPQPGAYTPAADLLDLRPEEVLMVAAHSFDLEAAAKEGLRTAYVHRPDEYGPGAGGPPWDGADVAADSLVALAEKLGC